MLKNIIEQVESESREEMCPLTEGSVIKYSGFSKYLLNDIGGGAQKSPEISQSTFFERTKDDFGGLYYLRSRIRGS